MTDMTAGSGCCWPEQEAVWAWMKRHAIELTFEQERDLKDSVSAYRITVQQELGRVGKALTAPRVPEGAFRILVAAGNRIAAEAEEVEGDEGMAVQILLDYWHGFLTALERAKGSLTAATAPTEHVARVGTMEVTHDDAGRVSRVNSTMPVFTTVKDAALATLRTQYEQLREIIDDGSESMTHDDAVAEVSAMRERVKVLESDYFELLYQVAETIPGQSRHETALSRLRAWNAQSNEPECNAAGTTGADQ